MAEENKNTAELTPPKSSFDKLKDSTKEMVDKLLSFFRQEKTEDDITKKSPSDKILKGIIKALIEREALNKDDFKTEKKRAKFEERTNEYRHREILKTLLNIPQPEPTVIEETPQEESMLGKQPTKKKPVAKKSATKKKRTAKKTPTKKPTNKKVTKPKKMPQKAKPQATKPSASKVSPKAVVAGGVAAGGVTGAIAGAESGGNYDMTFGDSLDNKGNIIRGKNMSPEQRFGKKLTDLTLEEVDILGKERNKVSPSTSAMGKYQFMNTTLFGTKNKPGLVQQTPEINMQTRFTKDVQDLLYKKLHEQDVATLKRLGVPITPGYEYMAHYLGAGGAKAVYDRRNTNLTVQQALIAAGLPDPVNGQTNKELSEKKASEFESILNGRLNKQGLKPHAVAPTTGETLDKKSSENGNLKSDNNQEKNKTTVNNVSVTTDQKSESKKTKTVDDRNPIERKYG